MFSDDDLDQARDIPVRDIAEKHGAQLKKEGRTLVGPCPYCGGRDRFIVWPEPNRWFSRWCDEGGDVIKLVMRLKGCSFVDAVKELIGKDAGTTSRREPTPDEISARKAREEQRRRDEAVEAALNEASAARIIARLQPLIGSPGEIYLREVRRIDVDHWAVGRALATLGWCDSVYFKQPGHELHGQYLGAIVAILTDPVTGERTRGISRTFIYEGRKIDKAKSLGGVGKLGITRLSPDDEVLAGLHICEGLETGLSLMMKGFIPLWAAGSTAQLAEFPVLDGIECLTAIADNDESNAGEKAAIKAALRWRAAGRQVRVLEPPELGDINDIVRRAR